VSRAPVWSDHVVPEDGVSCLRMQTDSCASAGMSVQVRPPTSPVKSSAPRPRRLVMPRSSNFDAEPGAALSGDRGAGVSLAGRRAPLGAVRLRREAGALSSKSPPASSSNSKNSSFGPSSAYGLPEFGYVPSVSSAGRTGSGNDQKFSSRGSVAVEISFLPEISPPGHRGQTDSGNLDRQRDLAMECTPDSGHVSHSSRISLRALMLAEGSPSELLVGVSPPCHSSGSVHPARPTRFRRISEEESDSLFPGLGAEFSAARSPTDTASDTDLSSPWMDDADNVRVCLGAQSKPDCVALTQLQAVAPGSSAGTCRHGGSCAPCYYHFKENRSCHHGRLCDFCHHSDHLAEKPHKDRQLPRPAQKARRRKVVGTLGPLLT